MKGAHVLFHRREPVTELRWREIQPTVKNAVVKPYVVAPTAPPTAAVRRVAGAIEGESLKVLRATAGQAATQNMASFKAAQWSGGEQLFWRGAKPGDRLELELTAPADGTFDIAGVLTKARDYAIVRLQLDDEPLGDAIDLYAAPDVTTTGEVVWATRKLAAGPHRLAIHIEGANDAAVKSYMVGLDYVRLIAK
jgi:hypothetical protein